MRRFVVLALTAALTLPTAGAHAVLPQDDAGTGKDAPDTPTASFVVKPGVVHTGHYEGKAGGDRDDWYAFRAKAGDAIEARMASAVGCIYLYGTKREELGAMCWLGYVELAKVSAVARVAGTYYMLLTYRNPTLDDSPPQAYRFSYALNGEAPAPTPADATPALPPAPRGLAKVSPAAPSGKHVVVAVVDTGINPYHSFFRAPALDRHPRTWLPGFPASARPVRLSLGAPTYEAAATADADTWAGLERSTYDEANDTFDTHLYTFPGTRVVGAVSLGEFEDPVLPPVDPQPVRDDNGHGTHSAGLAAGANLATADGNVLVVAVEVGQGEFEDGIRWAARQPWIDAITVSLGTRANVPTTFSPLGERTGAEWASLEAHRSGKPVFFASGNGVSNSGLAPDRCSTYTSEFTGPAWVTRIGAAKPANGNAALWHCVPVEAIARTDVDSPSFDNLTTATSASGTSASAPNTAGHYAQLLLAARRAGSRASRLSVLEHLLHAAAPVAYQPGAASPSPYPLSLAEQGYGFVDQAAVNAARTRIFAKVGPLPRPETVEWFAQDKALREQLWGPDSVTAADPDPQNDAGSGRDAPDTRSDKVRVKPGVRYDAMSTGKLTEMEDWFAFTGKRGDTVTFAVAAATLCYDLVHPSGSVFGTACGETYSASTLAKTLPVSGTWYLRVRVDVAQTYSFAYAVNGTPPPVFP